MPSEQTQELVSLELAGGGRLQLVEERGRVFLVAAQILPGMEVATVVAVPLTEAELGQLARAAGPRSLGPQVVTALDEAGAAALAAAEEVPTRR